MAKLVPAKIRFGIEEQFRKVLCIISKAGTVVLANTCKVWFNYSGADFMFDALTNFSRKFVAPSLMPCTASSMSP